MSQERKEQLYTMLFDVLQELTEHDGPEVIFDRIVDDFAATAEYHMGQATTFTEMLNTFRHDNPAATIPEATEDVMTGEYDIYDSQSQDRPVNWEAIEANLDPTTKSIMSGSPDKFLNFLKGIHFPDNMDK